MRKLYWAPVLIILLGFGSFASITFAQTILYALDWGEKHQIASGTVVFEDPSFSSDNGGCVFWAGYKATIRALPGYIPWKAAVREDGHFEEISFCGAVKEEAISQLGNGNQNKIDDLKKELTDIEARLNNNGGN